jgi:hypothetical protein
VRCRSAAQTASAITKIQVRRHAERDHVSG